MAKKIVTEERVRWAVSLFAPYKSPGIDGIFPALLQKGLDILIETVVKIFRACIAYGYIPVQWRTSRVVFVPKPGRMDYTLVKQTYLREHVQHKCKKSVALFWQCHHIVGKTWGIAPKIAHWIYTTIIRPMLTHGAVVWWPRFELRVAKTLLSSLQRLASPGQLIPPLQLP